MAWNDERIARLKFLWASGLSASEIANAMGGISRGSVLGKVHRLGLSGRATVWKRIGPPPGAFGLPTKKKSTRPRSEGLPRSLAKSVAPIPPPTPDDVPTMTFDDLEWNDGRCRWRIDKEFRGQPYGFCGGEVVPGFSECLKHAKRKYTNWADIEPKYVKVEEKELETT